MLSKAAHIAGFRTYRLVIIKSNWNVLWQRAIYANQKSDFGVKVAGCTQHFYCSCNRVDKRIEIAFS